MTQYKGVKRQYLSPGDMVLYSGFIMEVIDVTSKYVDLYSDGSPGRVFEKRFTVVN